MRRRIALGGALLLVFLGKGVQAAESDADKSKSVITLENAWNQAEEQHDWVALKLLLAEEFVYTDYDGRFMHRDEWLKKVKDVPKQWNFRALVNVVQDARAYGNTVVVTDVGQHQMWEAQYYKHEDPRSLITSGGLGTMGFALPAAIGAKVARPEAEVWVVVGDGGFQMTMCELATIVQENLKINIAIINNGFLGMVRQWQEFFYERNYQATPLLNPDFANMAEAYGIRNAKVTERSQVVPAVQAARQHDGPMLLNFHVEQEDTVYPMVAAGAALHEMIRRPSPIVETAADE